MGEVNRSLDYLWDVITELQEKVKILEAERHGYFIVKDGDKPTLMKLAEAVEKLTKRIERLE